MLLQLREYAAAFAHSVKIPIALHDNFNQRLIPIYIFDGSLYTSSFIRTQNCSEAYILFQCKSSPPSDQSKPSSPNPHHASPLTTILDIVITFHFSAAVLADRGDMAEVRSRHQSWVPVLDRVTAGCTGQQSSSDPGYCE